MTKLVNRQRRCRKSRAIIARTTIPRLVVHKTNKHIYATVIVRKEGACKVVAAASTNQPSLAAELNGSKTDKARGIGEAIAKLVIAKEIKQLAFDRSGHKYHGRVKAIAEAVRALGVKI